MLDTVKKFLYDSPGYRRKSPAILAERLNCSENIAKQALQEVRSEMKTDLTNENISEITEFKKFLAQNEIDEDTVKSVKFWQNMQGEPRFSVVVKGQEDILQQAKEDMIAMLEAYSPKVEPNYEPVLEPVAYEISLPEIHYGKFTGQTLDQGFTTTDRETINKALTTGKFLALK